MSLLSKSSSPGPSYPSPPKSSSPGSSSPGSSSPGSSSPGSSSPGSSSSDIEQRISHWNRQLVRSSRAHNEEGHQPNQVISKMITLLQECQAHESQDIDPLVHYNLSLFDPFTLSLDRDHHTVDKSVAIVADTGLPINPSLIKQGKCGAGSELALLELSLTLAKKGYQVRVFTNINYTTDYRWTFPCCNPRFLPIRKNDSYKILPHGPQYLNCLTEFTVQEEPMFQKVIVWRGPQEPSYSYRSLGRWVGYWSHDLPPEKPYLGIDLVYTLSEYHAELWKKKIPPRIKLVVGCNGLSTSRITYKSKSKRKAKKCIYASNYSRGLAFLLNIWPQVLREVPDATLDIYYGRQTWGQLSDSQLKVITDKIDRDKSITEHGMVPHDQLCRAFEEASILAYPCTSDAETFCIVTGIAQAKGCVPLVVPRGALKETVASQFLVADINRYADALITLLKNEHKINRVKLTEHVKDYTWEHCAEVWERHW